MFQRLRYTTVFYILLISAENDPLQLRPNPENLISKVSAEYRGYFNGSFYLGGTVYH